MKQLIQKLLPFFIILGILLGLIHLDIIAIWAKGDARWLTQVNILSGHTRVNPVFEKASKKK